MERHIRKIFNQLHAQAEANDLDGMLKTLDFLDYYAITERQKSVVLWMIRNVYAEKYRQERERKKHEQPEEGASNES